MLWAGPLLVMGVGAGLLRLAVQEMRGRSTLTRAVLGLAKLMAAAGCLRMDLERELVGRLQAEAELRRLNESLE